MTKTTITLAVLLGMALSGCGQTMSPSAIAPQGTTQAASFGPINTRALSSALKKAMAAEVEKHFPSVKSVEIELHDTKIAKDGEWTCRFRGKAEGHYEVKTEKVSVSSTTVLAISK